MVWWVANSDQCLAQVGINVDLTISRLLRGFPFPGEISHSTTLLRLILCKDSARVCTAFRVPPRAYVPRLIIDDISRLYPLPTPSVGCPPLPTCWLFHPLFLNSWTIFFISTTTNNKLVMMMGSMTLLLSFHVLFATSSTFRSKEHVPH